MFDEEILKNYKLSLEQKYNAVCFDIDGTLTEKNSRKIDSRAINMIANLLKRKIPIVFITGRGETGLKDLKNDIFSNLKNEFNISDNELKRMYVLTNDGARLFYTSKYDNDDIFNNNIYISTSDELDELKRFKESIVDNLNSKSLNNICDITYSEDLKTNTIINIRMVFKDNNEKLVEEVFKIIEEIIQYHKLDKIYVTRGIYKDKNVIQIGTAQKDKAIEKAEQIIGVPKNSMIRIGDCGDICGNDYSMLNCKQGYSVDKTSESINSCFPIFDDNGIILKGIDATLFLIQKAKILPTVCLEKANKKDYLHNFASIEKNIVLGRNKLLNKYNEIINTNFNDINGLDSLFDKFSGSIKIPMYEWELLKDNSLKELWSSSNNGNLKYAIRDDNNYLLRGSDTYYYFLSNRICINGKDITSKENVRNWHNNYLDFLKDSLTALKNTDNINDNINKKLILGILDNCRNVLLTILNHKLVSDYFNENILLDISSSENETFKCIYKNLMNVEKLMSNICFKDSFQINISNIMENVNITKSILKDNLDLENKNEEKDDYSKDYRAYREIDNFGENYVAVSIYDEKNNKNEFINSCGLSYGGIELPIISKIINQNKVERLLLLKFNKEVSGYTNKQLLDLRKFNLNDFGGLIGTEDISRSSIDLFDDNVLTGKTLQLAINSLYDFDINVKNVCIVRYPSINRIDQMFLENTAAVDYNLFFDYIYGLCFCSPYSWKDNEWENINGKIDYTDSLGIFDLNRKKIIECLVKNHNFNEDSEVGAYKRRLIL